MVSTSRSTASIAAVALVFLTGASSEKRLDMNLPGMGEVGLWFGPRVLDGLGVVGDEAACRDRIASFARAGVTMPLDRERCAGFPAFLDAARDFLVRSGHGDAQRAYFTGDASARSYEIVRDCGLASREGNVLLRAVAMQCTVDAFMS